jgi:iron complex outermembrane receptor protein
MPTHGGGSAQHMETTHMDKRRRPHHPRFATRAVALAALSLLGPTAARAQDSAAAPREETRLDKVEITGSIIKRVSQEAALPVTSIKSVEFEQRGHTQLKDFMLELPQAT